MDEKRSPESLAVAELHHVTPTLCWVCCPSSPRRGPRERLSTLSPIRCWPRRGHWSSGTAKPPKASPPAHRWSPHRWRRATAWARACLAVFSSHAALVSTAAQAGGRPAGRSPGAGQSRGRGQGVPQHLEGRAVGLLRSRLRTSRPRLPPPPPLHTPSLSPAPTWKEGGTESLPTGQTSHLSAAAQPSSAGPRPVCESRCPRLFVRNSRHSVWALGKLSHIPY